MAIKGIRDRALQRFFERRDARRLPPAHAGRIRAILKALDSNDPLGGTVGSQLPAAPPQGDRKGEWSAHVRDGWCVTSRTDGANGRVMNYENCHRGH